MMVCGTQLESHLVLLYRESRNDLMCSEQQNREESETGVRGRWLNARQKQATANGLGRLGRIRSPE